MASLTPIGIEEFVQISDIDAVRLFGTAFANELSHLKNASVTVESTNATALGCLGNGHETPSTVLYNQDFPEVNRTLVSMLAIKWVMGNDYSAFTATQKATNKLSGNSFQKLRDFYTSLIKTKDELHALLIAMVIDDIGKDPNLAEEMAAQGVESTHADHSDLVYKAAQANIIPSLQMASENTKEDIISCLYIGSKLNISQAVQGECPPVSLEILSHLQGQGQGVNLRAMVTFLDVAGAGGHADTRSCVVMGEPVFQAYMSALEAFDRFSNGSIPSPRACYDHILDTRAKHLEELGFAFPTSPDQARALSRLLCMGRVTTKKRANQFKEALDKISSSHQKHLVDGLNVDGIDDGVAIVPYYAPGLIADILKDTDGSDAMVTPVLTAFFRFLARVFDDCGSKSKSGAAGGMVEHDLSFVQDIIKSQSFRDRPGVLDDVSLPWK